MESNSSIFLYSAAPRKFLATITPFSSRTNVAGMAETLYNLAIGSFQNIRFDTWSQTKPSSSIAFNHLFLSLSRETPTILNHDLYFCGIIELN